MPKQEQLLPPMSARSLARLRYEGDASAAQIVIVGYHKIMEFFTAGRVPINCQRDICVLAEMEIEDKLAEQSVSWAENPARARTHPGSRHLMDDADLDGL